MKVAVLGLWHLGCVTAAATAAAGHDVVGLDDSPIVTTLNDGAPPVYEPGLPELIEAETDAGRLSFTSDPAVALGAADVLWVAIDTPVDREDRADVETVRSRLIAVADHLPPGAVVLISSQVPVGFTRDIEREWRSRERCARFAYSPENLRLGAAIDAFTRPARVIVGTDDERAREVLQVLFRSIVEVAGSTEEGPPLIWMSPESAEMAKHGLNAFLATSVTFANELARLCEVLGASAKAVERALKSDPRVGDQAYVAPGGAIGGGTLARDVRYLVGFGSEHAIDTPLFEGLLASNDLHKEWIRGKIEARLAELGEDDPVIAILGLTYKPGTDTLRRSLAVELCTWLVARGITVSAHDPAVTSLPDDLGGVELHADAGSALRGADVAVVATGWPEFRGLEARDFIERMRNPCVIDQSWFLSEALENDAGVTYLAPGIPGGRRDG